MVNKIALIQVWIGKIPDYFWFHYETTKNIKGIDFIFFTDQDIELSSENYTVVKTNIQNLEKKLSNILGEMIEIKSNKKICDLKASFGELFYEYIKNYDYFGCYDIDTLFGDVFFYIKDYLGQYDFITVGDEVYYDRLSGPFLLMRNTQEIRSLFKSQEYIDCFKSKDVECFEENVLNKFSKKKFTTKVIYSTNVETHNGGKITYECIWSGNKAFVNGDEKLLYHFYRKKNTRIQKTGNVISARYNKPLVDDFMWVVHFSEKYESLLPFLMNSIKKYSNRKCILYTINYSPSFQYKTQFESEQFIFRRIDIPKGRLDDKGRDFNIMCSKPLILLDAINNFKGRKFVHIDTDIYLTTNSDNITRFFSDLENYPLINSHIHDIVYLSNIVPNEEWTSPLHILLNELSIDRDIVRPRRKCNVIVFDEKSEWFLKEQMELFTKYVDSGVPGILSIYDEDTANALLTKYGFNKCLPIVDIEECYNIKMEKFTDMNHPFHMTEISSFVKLPQSYNDVLFFHGFKNSSEYEKIETDYNNSVLDCEEIVVSYENNCLFFEKNSFLSNKKIEGNVDFIIKKMNGDIVEILPNQSIMNYWFYLSNVFLEKGSYFIEIVKSDSKNKIYNNVLNVL